MKCKSIRCKREIPENSIFCPWCGTAVGRNANGRPRKFCSDKCRYDFWNYEKRHKAEKMELEARLNENR